MVVSAPEYTKNKYDLPKLKEIEEYVASVVEVNIPFNNPITGFCVRNPNSSSSLYLLTTRRLLRTRLVSTPRVRCTAFQPLMQTTDLFVAILANPSTYEASLISLKIRRRSY
jgi:hypothetical protein